MEERAEIKQVLSEHLSSLAMSKLGIMPPQAHHEPQEDFDALDNYLSQQSVAHTEGTSEVHPLASERATLGEDNMTAVNIVPTSQRFLDNSSSLKQTSSVSATEEDFTWED